MGPPAHRGVFLCPNVVRARPLTACEERRCGGCARCESSQCQASRVVFSPYQEMATAAICTGEDAHQAIECGATAIATTPTTSRMGTQRGTALLMTSATAATKQPKLTPAIPIPKTGKY